MYRDTESEIYRDTERDTHRDRETQRTNTLAD